ncbi:hypothetical protein R3P38DRAFT_2857145 [Favolaschia claudopus]|uniref:Uncharacterized protein n=1 Tax=Favolaschia claudopus TaxID=2862362 RepID=A0AAW0DII8_9AGAR
MEQDPEGRQGYLLCQCRSYDCGSQIWKANDGRILKGKWVSKSTKGRHKIRDEELVAEGALPPVRTSENPSS